MIFIFTHSLFGSSDTANNDSVYSSKYWKKMSDDPKEWNNFVIQMRAKGTCPCECIKKINEEKKDKALKKLFNTEQEFKHIKEKITALQRESQKPLNLIFSAEIPSDIQQLVHEFASKMQIKGTVNVYYGNNTLVNQKLDLVLLKSFYSEQSLCKEELHYLYQRCVLSHEFIHIKKKHPKIFLFVKNTIAFGGINNPIVAGWHVLFYYFNLTKRSPEQDKIDLFKLSRAQESEADREHAACGTVENARNTYLARKKSEDIFKTKFDIFTHTQDPEHPPAVKRTLWAKLIMHAKEAEYRLDQPNYTTKIKNLLANLKVNASRIRFFLCSFIISFLKKMRSER